jgi:succinyl-CoA synthetase alpha subunit
MKKPIVGFIAGVTAPPGKRMGHAGALISGGADTADAKLAIMEECGFTVTATRPKWQAAQGDAVIQST